MGGEGKGIQRFVGVLFDGALVLISLVLFGPLVRLCGGAPGVCFAASAVLGVVSCGLAMARVDGGGQLPSLGGLEGLLFVLTPASLLMLPMVLAGVAPKGVLGSWVWGMPIPLLFAGLLAFGLSAEHKLPERSWTALLLPGVIFSWLILTEALFVAMRQLAPPGAAVGIIFFLALFWLPARIIVVSADGTRWEFLSALGSFAWFCADLLRDSR